MTKLEASIGPPPQHVAVADRDSLREASSSVVSRGKRSRRRIVVVLLLAIAAAMGSYFWWRHASQQKQAAAAAGARIERSTTVAASKAQKGDLPIYLNGLGTVKALNTVTLRARVDGQLMKVAFVEGQQVKEGDLLAEIDSRPFQVQLEQAQGQLARDNALLANAKSDLVRYRQASMAVTQQQIDTAAATVAQYDGAVRIDQAQIDNAKLQIEYCHITAPLSGTIGLRLVDQGNMVRASDASGLAVITQMKPISVEFTLPQDKLPQVQSARANGTLTVEIFDRELKRRLAQGELTAIDNQINTSTGTILLKATCANEDGVLFSNQFVNVRLLVDTKRGAILIPSAAVQRSPQSAFVYAISPDGTAKVQNIMIGAVEGDTAQIMEGVNEGDEVVTDGVDKLRDGSKVTIRDPNAPKTPDAAPRSTFDKNAAQPAPARK